MQWIKLHSAVIRHDVCKDADTFRAWVWCLTNARHENGSYGGFAVDAGDVVSPVAGIMSAFGLPRRKARTIIEKLSGELGCLDLRLCRIGFSTQATIAKIRNWDVYQNTDCEDKVPESAISNRSEADAIKKAELEAELEKDRQRKALRDKQARETRAYLAVDHPIPEELDSPEFREAWKNWCEYRVKLNKRLNEPGVKMTLKRFIAIGRDAAIRIIENSIVCGYQGLFDNDIKGGANVKKGTQRNLTAANCPGDSVGF